MDHGPIRVRPGNGHGPIRERDDVRHGPVRERPEPAYLGRGP